ncbi:hypothetical protein PUN28_010743 [Cardiocondyla obscurior]|uniref:Uncharacterized protein n=1 Tax=Cardiocondyla obscurior TaxID=286306 RepID=A0AAW2FJ21_9HYME
MYCTSTGSIESWRTRSHRSVSRISTRRRENGAIVNKGGIPPPSSFELNRKISRWSDKLSETSTPAVNRGQLRRRAAAPNPGSIIVPAVDGKYLSGCAQGDGGKTAEGERRGKERDRTGDVEKREAERKALHDVFLRLAAGRPPARPSSPSSPPPVSARSINGPSSCGDATCSNFIHVSMPSVIGKKKKNSSFLPSPPVSFSLSLCLLLFVSLIRSLYHGARSVGIVIISMLCALTSSSKTRKHVHLPIYAYYITYYARVS